MRDQAAPTVDVIAGRDDRGDPLPVVVLAFPDATSPHRVRAALHRVAAAIDERSPDTERWRTEAVVNGPNEQRWAGVGGRVVVRLASYLPDDLAAENARALLLVEEVTGVRAR